MKISIVKVHASLVEKKRFYWLDAQTRQVAVEGTDLVAWGGNLCAYKNGQGCDVPGFGALDS